MVSSYIRDLSKMMIMVLKMLSLERPSVDKNNSMMILLNLVVLLLFIILRSLDLLFLHLLGLLLALAVNLVGFSIQVGLLEVDVPLGLLLLTLLGGLALHQLHPDHGQDEDQGGYHQGFLVSDGVIQSHKGEILPAEDLGRCWMCVNVRRSVPLE